MKVAAYQTPLLPHGSMAAIDLIAAQIRSCESAGVDILCCPEGVLGGLADYSSRPFDIAINAQNGQLQTVLAPLASETVTTILGFTELVDNDRLFNTAAVYHKGCVLGLARKQHPAINRSIYEPGEQAQVFTVGDLTFGILICRDSTYAELAHVLADRGATALFVPTNNALAPAKAGVEVVALARNTDIARARENSVWVIRADVAGRIDGLVSYGSTGIVRRDGTVWQTATQLVTGLLVAEVETNQHRQGAGQYASV